MATHFPFLTLEPCPHLAPFPPKPFHGLFLEPKLILSWVCPTNLVPALTRLQKTPACTFDF